MVPQTFCQLVRTHLHRLDQTLISGLTQITWSSLNVTSFLNHVETNISAFETFIKDVSYNHSKVSYIHRRKFLCFTVQSFFLPTVESF